VDVRIGVTYSVREIEVQIDDSTDRAALRSQIDEVLASKDKVLWLTDKKGREVGVPSGKIAFVELGATTDERAFGFSA
jgi:hypothetical protein